MTGVFVNDTKSDVVPRCAVASASVGCLLPLRPWQLNGFVRRDNLCDRRYAGSLIVNEGNSRFFEPAPGRTWLAGPLAAIKFRRRALFARATRSAEACREGAAATRVLYL